MFKYVNFTYTAQLDPSSNSTYTKVNIITNYNLGPIEFLITRDNSNLYDNIVAETSLGITFSNSAYLASQQYSFSTSISAYNTITVNIPELSVYTGAAVQGRLSQAAIAKGASGFGIAAVTSTNVWKSNDASVHAPSYYNNNGTNINLPLTSGGNTIFSTSFAGKSTYQLNYGNGTTSTYPIILANPTFTQLSSMINISNVFNGYFEAQTQMTRGFTAFFANQLGLSSSSSTSMDVGQTSYMTMVEMPVWSGYQINQDPTYSAVSAVSSQQSSTNPSSTKPVPGFEFMFLVAGLAVLVIYRRRNHEK